jgi:hypothetical protein
VKAGVIGADAHIYLKSLPRTTTNHIDIHI